MTTTLRQSADLERAHLLDGLARSDAWSLVATELGRRALAAREEALGAGTDDRARALAAARYRAIDECINWPGRTAAEIYERARKEGR
jgi:hypothetical protein